MILYSTGYGKTVSHVVIGLRTVKGAKQLKLDPSIYETLQKEKVEIGDVIYIEANSGAVKVCMNKKQAIIESLLLTPSTNFFIRDKVDVMLLQPNMILKPKSMFHYQKVMFIRKKKLYKMLRYMIWMLLMLDHKVDKIFYLLWVH